MREISLVSATSKNFIDATYHRQGLHDTPRTLTEQLQREISRIDSGEDIYSTPGTASRDFDAIVLGYGLCSNAMEGLYSEKYPLIIPRVHDCIALLMGSRAAYDKFVEEHNGAYYYTPSWIEAAYTPSEESNKWKFEEYAELYGEENAEFLMESEICLANYNSCAYISWPELPFPEYEEYTKRAAEFLGFEFKKADGSPEYIRALVSGDFDDERFLTVPVGYKVELTYEKDIFRAVPR